MTTADDLGYDDPDEQPGADEKARREAAFAQRKQAREAEKAELAELRQFKADAERREALDKARGELNAEGPLGAFLRTYDGEPTADAIKAAVEADPDFKGLVTFTPDERDAAASEQAANARKLAGGGSAPKELTSAEISKWPMDKKARFRKEHTETWNTLMSDPKAAVAAPAGWA